MTYTPDNNATLLHLDEREAEILRILPHLKNTLPSQEYRHIEAQYAKEIQQMDTRRRILQAVEREEALRDIRASLSACGVLITRDKQ